MSASRRGVPKTEEHKAKIAASNRGKVRERRYEKTCPCGRDFRAASPAAIYCTLQCKRAAGGHGLIHAPAWAHFDRACAICQVDECLVGDHDHETGNARGVLCRNCNVGLGYLGHDPERLESAARYLRERQCAST